MEIKGFELVSFVAGAIGPILVLVVKTYFEYMAKRRERDISIASLVGELKGGFDAVGDRISRLEEHTDEKFSTINAMIKSLTTKVETASSKVAAIGNEVLNGHEQLTGS